MTPDDWAVLAVIVIGLALIALINGKPKGPRPA